MTEDMIKGFQFFDDETVYNVSDAGRSTNEGGEIFNDYVNNQALAPFSKASGTACRAGIYGYRLLAVDVNEDGTRNAWFAGTITCGEINLIDKINALKGLIQGLKSRIEELEGENING